MDPGLDFALGETADTIRDTTRAFRRRPHRAARRQDRRRDRFPRELWPEMGALGLHGITVEEGWRPRPRLSRACRRAGGSRRASASIGLSYGAHSNLCVNQIRRWAMPEQKAQISAQADLRRTCRQPRHVRGGRGLRRRLDEAEGREEGRSATSSTAPSSGSPTRPMPTRSSSMPRPAAAEPSGITAFLIEKDMTGFSIGQKIDKMGMRGSPPPSWSSTIAKCRTRTSWARSTAASAC